ncbi:unnamed protein product [Staurois parvus]|uniref:Uncharacterized protein n=1 Tax=Staurois parvus TaxID=386267 RepID=A0ABN9CG01_9NEOB|nr:unnamed protein product [Staurois parvus]
MRGSHHPCAEFLGLYTRCAHYEGSHHPCAQFRVCTPAVLIMRGSHHPCAEFQGLYTRCAHYEGFPPSLCSVPGSVHLLCSL